MTISGYLDLLRDEYDGKLSSEAKEMIDYAIAATQRMNEMIDSLLAYAMAKKDTFKRERVDLNVVVQETLSDLKAIIDQKGARIECGNLPVVNADKSQLLQLFRNLIGNAVKFQIKGAAPQVGIVAVKKGKTWRFSVSDNGIGFDGTWNDKIFQPFERRHREGQFPGTGLGLAICKKIVERHRGQIWAEAEPGKGATFYFTLEAA